MRTRPEKVEKALWEESQVESRSNLCTLMDVNFSPVNKRDPGDKIAASTQSAHSRLHCLPVLRFFFSRPKTLWGRRREIQILCKCPRSEKNEKFLHSELWYLFMATSNTIISFMKSILTIMGISFSSSFVSAVYGFLMNFVLTFSSGMFLFIAVVSGRWRRNRQVSYVRRRGEARRRRRPGRSGDSGTGTAHSPTAPAHYSR